VGSFDNPLLYKQFTEKKLKKRGLVRNIIGTKPRAQLRLFRVRIAIKPLFDDIADSIYLRA